MEGKFIKEENCSRLEFCGTGEAIPPYVIKMLEQNAVSGLLDMRIVHVNNQNIYSYNVQSFQPLSELCRSRDVAVSEILKVLESLDRTVNELEEFFLDRDGVLLDPQYIMCKPADGIVRFAYAAENETGFDESLKKLFEYFMEHMKYDSREQTVSFYEAYQSVMRRETDITALIDTINGSTKDMADEDDELLLNVNADDTGKPAENSVTKEPVNPALVIAVKFAAAVIAAMLILSQVFSASFPVRIPLAAAVILLALPAAMYAAASRFRSMPVHIPVKKDAGSGRKTHEVHGIYGADTDNAENPTNTEKSAESAAYEADAADKTEELAAKCHSGHLLELWLNDEACGEKLYIDELPCVFGSRRSMADIAADNMYISRVHAEFSAEDGACFVKDLFSTNGTFVNGVKLVPNEKKRINDGDVITFASQTYRVVNLNPI